MSSSGMNKQTDGGTDGRTDAWNDDYALGHHWKKPSRFSYDVICSHLPKQTPYTYHTKCLPLKTLCIFPIVRISLPLVLYAFIPKAMFWYSLPLRQMSGNHAVNRTVGAVGMGSFGIDGYLKLSVCSSTKLFSKCPRKLQTDILTCCTTRKP